MMTYRAFVFDISGTLLDSQGVLRPRVVAALESLRQTGALLLTATSLPQRFARGQLAAAPYLCDRGVFLAGAHLVDEPTGFDRQIPFAPEAGRELIEALCEADPALQVLVRSGPDLHGLRLPVPADEWASWGYPAGSLIPFQEACQRPCIQIMAWHESLDLRSLCAELERQFEGRARLFTANHGRFLQATAWEATKGQGLLQLLEHLGIAPADAVAMGDDLPDVDMFRLVGTSIAMGNAPTALQDEATWVTASSDEDGVALAIERLLGL